MFVQHNLSAYNAQRMYGIVTKKKAKSTEKLSSGYRINRSADDAASLSISEKMRRQIRGLSQGVENTEDGVSLCQVADGALGQVSEMLHRVTELSVKAANGTNTAEDRAYIQKEIHQILAEIDRVGDTTFNEEPIFKGCDEILRNADGTPMIKGQIPFEDFKLVDLDLGRTPFSNTSDMDDLNLTAIVKNSDSAANGKYFNLIYGNGSTSHSSIKFNYKDASGNSHEDVVKFRDLTQTIKPPTTGAGGTVWNREIAYKNADAGIDIKITQSISIEDGADEKNYSISYKFDTNNDANKIKDFNLGFMFHADTAYNNNDRCEGYFIEGNSGSGERVDKFSIYVTDPNYTANTTNPSVIKNPGLDSFSIVDVDSSLSFTEKIDFSTNHPDYVTMGHYNSIHDWNYINGNEPGTSSNRADMGFSLVWNTLPANAAVSFKYGIMAVEKDNNIRNIPLNRDSRPVTNHYGDRNTWIHSGCEAGDGMWVTIGEMNTEVLGIKGIDVSTVPGAEDAMGRVKEALNNVISNRSRIGAQQNRLEHTISNEENIVENTAAAESKMRDTDMAAEMVSYSNANILDQVGQAMMAQANQMNQGVLSLLS